jgi:hypothetical protein
MDRAINALALLACSKKPQDVTQGSFFDSFFGGRQTFAARTSQNAAPTL